MALYIGDKKVKLNLDGELYIVNLYNSQSVITNGIRLLSSDGFILKDLDELYLTAKEEDDE